MVVVVDDTQPLATTAAEQAELDRLHLAFRSELGHLRNRLRNYVFIFGRASGATHFAADLDRRLDADVTDANLVFASTSHPLTTDLVGTPRRHMTRWLDPKDLAISAWHTIRCPDDRDANEDERDTQEDQREAPEDDRDTQEDEREAPEDKDPSLPLELEDREEIWFDYVADMGDAFDPQMHVAWLLGRDELKVGPAQDSQQERLPRGELLVLGGDELYPYAREQLYKNQVDTPFAHAWNPRAPRCLSSSQSPATTIGTVD